MNIGTFTNTGAKTDAVRVVVCLQFVIILLQFHTHCFRVACKVNAEAGVSSEFNTTADLVTQSRSLIRHPCNVFSTAETKHTEHTNTHHQRETRLTTVTS